MMKTILGRGMALVCCGLSIVVFSTVSFAQRANGKQTEMPEASVVASSNEAKLGSFSDESVNEASIQSTLAASDQSQGNSPENTQSQTPPGNNPQAPSLEDLGLSPSQTQANPELQARLDKRSHMLKLHQRLGLITAVPMIATVATSFGAGGRSTSTNDRWAHLALGAATSDLYFTTAYFAIFAPKIPGTHTQGPIRVHKALAWIHGPGMILTPILGAIAFEQKSKGERVHGIASAHGPVAIVTAGAFGAALLSVSVKF